MAVGVAGALRQNRCFASHPHRLPVEEVTVWYQRLVCYQTVVIVVSRCGIPPCFCGSTLLALRDAIYSLLGR
jgi:hypothetical protein